MDQRPRPLADLALGMGLASEVMMGALPRVQHSNRVSLRHGPSLGAMMAEDPSSTSPCPLTRPREDFQSAHHPFSVRPHRAVVASSAAGTGVGKPEGVSVDPCGHDCAVAASCAFRWVLGGP